MVFVHSVTVLFDLEPLLEGTMGGGGPSLYHSERGPQGGPQVRGAVKKDQGAVSGR